MEKYLIYGLGISGISSAKTLAALGKTVYIFDEKDKDQLKDVFNELEGFNYEYIEDLELGLKNADIVVKSPGISNHNPHVQKAEELGLEIVSDLELVTRLFPDRKVIAITGTNGKTTTTTLMKEILLGCGLKGKAIGNIGLGMLWEIYCGNADDIYIIECSSFQLANTKEFRPDYSAIINITPDHIDWHGDYKEYIDAKKNIFINQYDGDYCVLNMDNDILSSFSKSIPSRLIQISPTKVLDKGIFVEEGSVYSTLEEEKEDLLKKSEIPLKGSHNLENVLITLGISFAMGLDKKCVVDSIRKFKAVEHRMEFVRELNGVEYYNDSKGTNVDASIKAIEAFDNPIILLAGGYDKKADLIPLFDVMQGKVKKLFIFGDTKKLFKKLADQYNIEGEIVADMKEAVQKAYASSYYGDVVLLSPASAAWGMYDNFEIRGKDFKENVKRL